MSRKMTDANARVFAKLTASLPANFDVGSARRYLTTHEHEKSWLKESVFHLDDELMLGDRQFFAFGKYRHERFVVSVGNLIQEAPSELSEISANAGMVTAILSELEIPIVNAPGISDTIREYVFFPSTDSLVGYEAAEIRHFFEPFQLFRVLERQVGEDEHDMRLSVLLAARVRQTHQLQFLPSTLALCETVARDPAAFFPFHLLTRSLLERRWEHVFLAIYRCIEQLYPIKSALEVRDRLSVVDWSPHEVASVLEEVLSWRRKEEEALQDLFKCVDQPQLCNLGTVLGLEAQHPQSAAKAIYKLRNDCVHFRPFQARTNQARNINWASLVDALLTCAIQMYKENSKHLGPKAYCSAK